MKRALAITFAALCFIGTTFAGEGDHDTVPTLKNQPKTSVAFEGNTVTLTFGPIDLPVDPAGELAASMPLHYFTVPRDMYMVSFKSSVSTIDGRTLPNNYLHHLLMINTSRKSVSCPGEPLFFAGAGLELLKSEFPPGHGVKLEKGQKIMTVAAFYL